MKPLSLWQNLKLTGQVITHLRGLKRRPYWSSADIQRYQLQQIQFIVGEAKDNVPLYSAHRLPDPRELKTLQDLTHLPILTKNDLLNAGADAITNKKFLRDDLIVSKSSGSTGRSLDVYYDNASYNLFILAALRLYWMAFSYSPWHRQTYIYTSPYPIKSLFGLYSLDFIPTLNPVDDTIQRLRRSPPDLLVCYPSHLRSIAERMSPADYEIIRPQAINVNSEMSSPQEREYLAKKFQAFVFDDYSSEELTRIASQCRHLSYHIFDDLNYIEIVDKSGRVLPEGQVGDIVGTNLHNVGMPLIRYNQGDRGSISNKTCACGRSFRILERLEGRKNDAFVLSQGEVISSGYLLDLTYGVFLDYPNAVNSFCLVQEEPDRWVLELVPGQNWAADLKERIPGDLKTKLARPSVKIECRIVSSVRKTQSGKANPIISLVKKQE